MTCKESFRQLRNLLINKPCSFILMDIRPEWTTGRSTPQKGLPHATQGTVQFLIRRFMLNSSMKDWQKARLMFGSSTLGNFYLILDGQEEATASEKEFKLLKVSKLSTQSIKESLTIQKLTNPSISTSKFPRVFQVLMKNSFILSKIGRTSKNMMKTLKNWLKVSFQITNKDSKEKSKWIFQNPFQQFDRKIFKMNRYIFVFFTWYIILLSHSILLYVLRKEYIILFLF